MKVTVRAVNTEVGGLKNVLEFLEKRQSITRFILYQNP